MAPLPSLLCTLVLLTLYHCTPATAQYLSANLPYSYDSSSSTGPDTWYKLSSASSVCRNGQQQSPIDIVTVLSNQQQSQAATGFGTGLAATSQLVTVASVFTPPTTNLPAASTSSSTAPSSTDNQLLLTNNGATLIGTVYLNTPSTANPPTISINATTYQIQTILFHSPSEHTLNGGSADMEVQLIGANTQNSDEMLGFSTFMVLPAGASTSSALGENTFLSDLGFSRGNSSASHAFLPNNTGQSSTILLSAVNWQTLVSNSNTSYFTYQGSLTIPPCTQDIQWVVQQYPITLSLPQKLAFTDVFGSNTNRDLQNVNGRIVQYDVQPTYNYVEAVTNSDTDQMIATILLCLVGVLSFGLFISRDVSGYWYWTKHGMKWMASSLRPSSLEAQFRSSNPGDAYAANNNQNTEFQHNRRMSTTDDPSMNDTGIYNPEDSGRPQDAPANSFVQRRRMSAAEEGSL